MGAIDKYKELGVEKLIVFDGTDGINYEAIANAEPDIILATYSALTQKECDSLSGIAPVIVYPDGPYQTRWREHIQIDVTVLGYEQGGIQMIEDVEN